MNWVLLAGDDAFAAAPIVEALGAAGVFTLVATSAEEATKVLRRDASNVPSIIIIDTALRGARTVVSETLADKYEDVPVLALSAKDEGLSARVNAIFEKPVAAERFAGLVARILARVIAERQQ